MKKITQFVLRFFICWFSSSAIITTIDFLIGRVKYSFKNKNRWPNQILSSWSLEASNWFIYFLFVNVIYFLILYMIFRKEKNLKKIIIFSSLVAILPFIIFAFPYSFYSINASILVFCKALFLFGFVGALIPIIDYYSLKGFKKIQNKIFFSCIILTSVIASSCSHLKTSPYFKLTDNKITRFKGLFVKDKTDSNYIMMENIYGKLFRSDTLIDINEVVYKTANIDGYKTFYTLQVKDTTALNPTIGANYFIDCAMLFRNDTMFIASAYYKNDLKKLNLKNFKVYFPPILKQTDSISYYWKSKKTTLTDFKKENIIIENKKFNNCLKIKIIEIYPDTIKYSYVWLTKKFGLIKWIRASGRIDTRIF